MFYSKIYLITILLWNQIHQTICFNFSGLNVNTDSTTINVTTNYQFYFDRTVDNTGSLTAYATNTVPAGSTVVIVFPSVYTLSGSYTCTTGTGVTVSCSVSSLTLTISGLYNSATNVTTLEIDVANILNPSPAVTTGYFYGYIGIDEAVPNSQSTVTLKNASFTSCLVTFNPSYMNKTQSMIFTLQPKNLIWTGGYISIQFPSRWNQDLSLQTFNFNSTMNCSNLTSNVSPNLVCSGYSNYSITVTSLFTSNNINTFSFSIANITSPPNSNVVSLDKLTITSYYQGNQIDICTPYVTGLTPNVFSSITATTTPSIPIVNTMNVSIKLTILCADTFSTAVNTIQIIFPSSFNLTMSLPPSNTFLGSYSYSFTSTNNTLTVTPTSNKVYWTNSTIYVNFYYWTVPPSIATLSAITFNIQRNGLTTQTGTVTIQPTVSSNITLIITPTITTVSTNTSYVFSLTLGDGISSSGLISISFPSTISLLFTSSNCASVVGTSTNSAPTCTLNSSNTLLLTNLNSSNAIIPAQTLTITISGVQNPSTTQPTSTFNITTYYTSALDMVATVSTGSITATAGILNSSFVSLTSNSLVVKNTNTTYTFAFNNLNTLPTSSIIQLGIPSVCLISTTLNCTGIIGTGTLSSQTCVTSVIGQYTYINITSLFVSTSAAANSSLKIALNGMITNPPSTQPVTGFSIILFASSGYIINQYVSGLSLTMTTPANFNTMVVTHSSNVNYALNSITITLSQPSPFSTGSSLAVYFPSTIVPQSTVACTDLTSASVPCTLNSNTITANLLSNVSNTNFGLIISNVNNAPSLKPSDAFGFATLTSTGYDYSKNLASVTSTNTQTSSFPTLTGTFSSLLLGSSQTLTITFKPTTAVTGWLIIKLASSFNLNSLGCSGWSGSCSVSSYNLNISGIFNLSTVNTISITGFTSPNSIPSDYTTITTYDPSGYSIDSNNGTILFQTNCTLPCATCSPAVTNCITCYKSTSITTYNYYYSVSLSCLVSCPSNTYTDNINYLCVTCSSICLTCNSTNYCLSCLNTSSNPYLNINSTTSTSTCIASCPVGSYANTSQANYFCSLCVSPCSQCLSPTYCTACVSGYYFNSSGSNCLVSCTPNFTITNSSNMSCDACSSVCYTCLTTTVNCVSCSSTAALYLGICVATCPSPLVVNSGSCTPCTNPCLTCVTTATNCTSCNSSTTTPLLLNNTCYTSCPTYYYNNSASGICYNCSNLGINCANCINSTTCSTTCDTGYVYFNGNCLATVPSGYVNISGIALACTSGCSTCSILQSNCTACNSSLYFYFNTCVGTCPTGFAAINLNCTACVSPCFTCITTTSNCLSCNPTVSPSVYLFGTSCLTTCPSTTYPNLLNNTCTTCVSPCKTCTDSVTCITCVSTYSLYSSNCLLNCPSGYASVNSICLICISPCATCSGSQTLCSSCLANLSPNLYLSSTQCVIASSCGVGTYPNSTNYTCSDCVSPCATCSSSTVCLSCIINFYFYLSTCTSTCLPGYVGINSACVTCTSPCSTCSVTQTNCTACVTNLIPNVFLNGNTCVTSSNCPSTTYGNTTNNICTSCVNPCSTCVSLTGCTSCISTYSLYSSICLSNCPTGYVSINFICVQCTSPCNTCDSTVTNCTSCLTNLSPSVYLSINSCIIASLCPSSTYANSTTNTCSNCPTNCATCTSLIFCNSCAANYYLQGSSCLSSCNSGYQQINSVCTQCTSPCATCSITLTNCTSCLSTINPAVYLAGNYCVNISSCPYGTYGNNTNNQCTSCNSPCESCSSASICLSCVTSYSLHNSNCITTCPAGYYSNSTNCLACTSPCATCSSAATNCTGCITSLNPTVYLTTSNTCVTAANCPSQTYANGSNYQCSACVSPCLTCTTLSSCLTCANTYNYRAANNSCLSSCPSGQTAVSAICTTCSSPCLTCSGSVTSCLSCLTSITPAVYLQGTSCTTTCNSGYYADLTSRTCLACVSPCATCTSQSLCLSCSIGNLYNSGCVTPCPSGYYSSNSICLACTSPCLTCSTAATNCTSCITILYPSVYLTTFYTCVTAANCPYTTYANGSNYQCVTCVAPCYTCTNATYCISCLPNYNFTNNTCNSPCPTTQIPVNFICTACTSPCLTCFSSVTSCVTCDPAVNPTVYLSGTYCTTSCPSGYYGDVTSRTCLSCVSPCLTCSGASICLSCVTNNFLYNSNCVTSCPTGYVSNTSNCLACSSPCLTCSAIVTNCTSCITSLNPAVYLTTFYTCVIAANCPITTYANGSNYQCVTCVAPCYTCTNATYCISCLPSYNFTNNTCNSPCPTTQIPVNFICTACTSPCLTCFSSVTSCVTCDPAVNPTVYLSGTYCTTSCPSGYYGDVTSRTCLSCVSPCLTCSGASICLSCTSGYVIYNSNCITTCPAGYYSNSTNCLACTSPCATCSSAATNCTGCITSLNPTVYLTTSNTCVTAANCPSQTYANGSNYQCSACVSPCLTCTTLSSCLTCANTYNYRAANNSCLSSCPSGQTAVSAICTTCSSPCLTCSGSVTSCLSCDASITPAVYLSSTSCTTTCNSGYYADLTSRTCLACVSPCATCTSQSLCLSCSIGNLYNSGCVTPCPSGYYSSNSICLACTSPCLTCSTAATNCTSCITSLNPAVYLTTFYTCVIAANCPIATYANGSNYQCVTCVAPCYTCTSSTLCLTCLSGYSYQSSNNSCLNSCPTGKVSINSICIACASPCLTCSGSISSCLSCITSLSPTVYLYSTSCTATCPTFYYADINTYTCLTCVSPCKTCTDQITCLSCVTSYSLHNSNCITTCPAGYYSNSTNCLACTSPCATCSSAATNCTGCITSLNPTVYLTTSNTCVTAANCPSQTYANGSNYQCSACVSPCLTCTTLSSCLTCANTYNYRAANNSCLSSCPSGQTAVSAICTTCSSPCLTCSGSVTSCLSCDASITPAVYLSSTSCTTTCPTYYYADITTRSCLPCVSPCLTCTNQVVCLTCISGYSFYSSSCYSTCPAGYYSNSTNCLACTSPCATCSSAAGNCISCITTLSPSVYLTNNNCVTAANCPSQTYANGSNYQCSACVSPCLTCTTLSSCLTCANGYNYRAANNSCLSSCPSGQTAVSAICTTCSSPCLTCSGSVTSCLSCDASITPAVYLSSTSCTTTCPTYYYADITTRSCLPCVSPCLTCTNQVVCLTCISGYSFYSSSCYSTCPAGYYSNSTNCLACTSPCATCSSAAGNCISCITTLSPSVYLTNNNCVTAANCPSQTYANGSNYQCSACVSPCLTCTTLSSCLTCANTYNYRAANNSCLSSCPSGQTAVSAICTTCSSPCLTCSGSVTSCLSCDASITPAVYLSSTSCTTTCPTYYYADITTRSCLPCVSPCSTCTNQLSCLSCSTGYLYNLACYPTCPAGYYQSNSLCIACNSPCLTCSNTATNCTSCLTTLSPAVYLSNSYTCVIASSCPTQTYANSSNYQCSACVSPCLTCTSISICTSCITSYYTSGSLCVSTCPLGQISINSICVSCTSPCLTCANQLTSCLSCDPSLNPTVYLLGNSCSQTCPSSTYPNTNNLTCTSCVSPCATCTAISVCVTCSLGYSFYSNYCYSACPSGLVSVSQICVGCTSPCLTCINSTTICLSCVNGYYYISTSFSCVTTCPSNLFINSTSQTCVGCLSPCSTCTSYPNNCTSCISTYYLLDGSSANTTVNSSCMSSCPSSYYILGLTCQNCPSLCQSCTSFTICTSCITNYVLYLSNCVTSCPAKSVVVNNSCASCSDMNCQNCSAINNCTTCTSPYLLLNGSCYQTCPNSYIANVTYCYLDPAVNSLNSSLSSANLLPMPFTIATGGIIIICFILKFKYENFFVSGGIFSLTSIPEVLVNIYFAYLYYQWVGSNFSDKIFLVILAFLGFLYILNIACFLIVNCIYLKDEEFSIWIQSIGSKATYGIVTILSVFLNHKIINIIFCNLFHFSVFKAKLIHVSKLFCVHFLWFISLIYTIAGVTLASYHLYTNNTIKNQLYIQSFDLIIVFLLNAIFGFLNTHKGQNFFDQDNLIFDKKNKSEDEFNATISSSANIMMQKQKGKGSNYKHAEIDSDLHENLTIVQQIQQMSSFTNNNDSKLKQELKNKQSKIKKSEDTKLQEDDLYNKQRNKNQNSNMKYIDKDIQQSDQQQSVIFDKNDDYIKVSSVKNNNKSSKLKPDFNSESEQENFLRMNSIRKNIEQNKPKTYIKDKSSIFSRQNKEDIQNISFKEDIFHNQLNLNKTVGQDIPKTQIRDKSVHLNKETNEDFHNIQIKQDILYIQQKLDKSVKQDIQKTQIRDKSIHLNKETIEDIQNIQFKQDRPFSKQINNSKIFNKSMKQDFSKSKIKDKSILLNQSAIKQDKIDISFNQDIPSKYQKSDILNKSIIEDLRKSQIRENYSGVIHITPKQDFQKFEIHQEIPKDNKTFIQKSVRQDRPRNEFDQKSTVIMINKQVKEDQPKFILKEDIPVNQKSLLNKSQRQDIKISEINDKSLLHKTIKEDINNRIFRQDVASKISEEAQLKSYKDDSFAMEGEDPQQTTKIKNIEFERKLKQKQSQLAQLRKKIKEKQAQKMDYDMKKGDESYHSNLLSDLKQSEPEMDQNRKKIDELSMSIVQKKDQVDEYSVMQQIQKSLQKPNILGPIKKKQSVLKNEEKLSFNFNFPKISQQDVPKRLKSSINKNKIIYQENQSEDPRRLKQVHKYIEDANKIIQSSQGQQDIMDRDSLHQNSKKSNQTIPQRQLRFQHEIDTSLRESQEDIIKAPTYFKFYRPPNAEIENNLLASKNKKRDTFQDSTQTIYRLNSMKKQKQSLRKKQSGRFENLKKKIPQAENDDYLSQSEPDAQRNNQFIKKREKDISFNKFNQIPQDNGSSMQFKVLGPHVSKAPVLNNPVSRQKYSKQQEFPIIDRRFSLQKNQNTFSGNLQVRRGLNLEYKEDRKPKEMEKNNTHLPKIPTNSRQRLIVNQRLSNQSKNSKSIQKLMNTDMNNLPHPKYDEQLKQFYKSGLSRSKSKGKKQPYELTDKDRRVEKIYLGRNN